MSATARKRRALKPLRFTLEQITEADDLQCGYCLACGAMQECCEPDARNYRCDNCHEREVFGAQELLIRGFVR